MQHRLLLRRSSSRLRRHRVVVCLRLQRAAAAPSDALMARRLVHRRQRHLRADAVLVQSARGRRALVRREVPVSQGVRVPRRATRRQRHGADRAALPLMGRRLL